MGCENNLGDRKKSHNLDNDQTKGISTDKRIRDVGIISEETLPSFLESIRRGTNAFRFAGFCFCSLTIKVVLVLMIYAFCLDYLEGWTCNDRQCPSEIWSNHLKIILI